MATTLELTPVGGRATYWTAAEALRIRQPGRGATSWGVLGGLAEVRPAGLATAAVGFLPVTLIAASAFGVAELRTLATHVLVPVLTAGAVALVARGRAIRLLAPAFVAGVVATLLYDSFRFGFLGFGLMHHDPIPNIGEALHLRPAWVAGYLWRYLGNGTGLALAFFALGLRGIRAGVLYGLFVCAGLLLTLAVSPYGTQLLFPITVWSAVMAIGGHVIFGAVVGWFAARTHARRSQQFALTA
jgi:hypothetical protein